MTSRPGQSTYGLACMQCYKAKCRCVPSSHGHACERCQRLRKDCQPTEASRRRNPAQRSEQSDSRIAQLEAKVESLLSTLQSVSNTDTTPEPIAIDDSDLNAPSLFPDAIDLPPSPPLSHTSQSQAEQCLDLFRTRMLPHFPFISLPPNLSAWHLKQARPFLFHAILTVTALSKQEKASRAEHLKRLASTAILIKMQSNIDLLLGLLTYLTWNADAFIGGADIVSRFMMLAVSMVYDLRLFKPSAPDAKYMTLMSQQGHVNDENDNRNDTALDFMEKQRALLACFVLSSNVASHLGRQDALRWTTHMDGALQVIENNCKSCPTDEAFAFQVRLHVLKQKAAYIREEHDTEQSRTGFATATTSLPGLLYLKTLRGQLRELSNGLSSYVPHKDMLITYTQHTELYLNQLAYSLSWDSPRLELSAQRIDLGINPGYERLECLWRSVENIKTWLDHFYEIPPSELIGLPFHFWSHMIRCLVILKYLAVLNDDAWDRQAVRNHVCPIATCDLVAERLRMASSHDLAVDNGRQQQQHDSQQRQEETLFELLIKLLMGCKVWAQTKMNMTPLQQQEDIIGGGNVPCPVSDLTMEQHQQLQQQQQIPDFDQMGILQSMNLESEQWIGHLFQGKV